MVGRVHLHQGAHQVRAAAGHGPDLVVSLDVDEGGGHFAGTEQVVLAADLQDVGVLGHDPEGMDPLQPRLAQGVVGAQPAVGVVRRRILGVGLGRDHRAGDVFGDFDARRSWAPKANHLG